MEDKKVPTELIEQIIEAGTYAPNHFRTEPWRFFVLSGEGRTKLGDVFVDITKSELEELESDASQTKIER
ncbi:nitroreductase family protein, partial [Microvirga sp. 3-52]|nr:nitroreductase family protein [Microvirga sp. 3-52]